MRVENVCVLISSFSFYAYIISYFVSPNMKNEFKRFKLEQLSYYIILLEFIGATGLLIGLKHNLILSLSSLGLGLLMFCGLIVRIRMKDSILISIPAAFLMFLNLYIFISSLK
jgi:hypothetical protein